MKNLILSFFIMISSFFMISCISMEDVAYHDEYVVGTTAYPVYYINSYPYYWFDNAWIMIPSYRYVYIRHIDTPRYIHAYRPNPHHYWHHSDMYNRHGYGPGDYRGHRPHSGGPHTLQPNWGGSHNRPNNGGYRPNGGNHKPNGGGGYHPNGGSNRPSGGGNPGRGNSHFGGRR